MKSNILITVYYNIKFKSIILGVQKYATIRFKLRGTMYFLITAYFNTPILTFKSYFKEPIQSTMS